MAESDAKNDHPFQLRFWQLDMVQARVLDFTIRATDASEISRNLQKNTKPVRVVRRVKKGAVTFRVASDMSVETISERT